MRLGNPCVGDSALMSNNVSKLTAKQYFLYFSTSSLHVFQSPYKSPPLCLAHCCLFSHSKVAIILCLPNKALMPILLCGITFWYCWILTAQMPLCQESPYISVMTWIGFHGTCISSHGLSHIGILSLISHPPATDLCSGSLIVQYPIHQW